MKLHLFFEIGGRVIETRRVMLQRARTTGRSAEVLGEGSGIRVDGTAGAGPAISASYIKDTGNVVPSQEDPPA